MKLRTNNDNSTFSIHSYNDDGIKVNDQILAQSFIITPDNLISNWRPNNFSDLTIDDVNLITDLEPEIIILGSGNKTDNKADKKLFSPPPEVMKIVRSKNIGFEVMDTYAACRCYSILISEGRTVAAALILN